ncbi:MAG: aminomethyltransferase beta-barrel domain-containing protein, partial [Alphaproteobacteria bacterium]
VVQRLRPEAGEPGEIVDLAGQVLGRHQGIIHYTVGQRRGLGIGGRSEETEPLYVVRLDAAARRVVVGPRAALGKPGVRIAEVNWLGAPPAGPVPVQVKLRSAMAPVAASLDLDGRGGGRVVFDEPQFGVAPGQACVAYDGDRMLGGGWIAAEPAQAAA